MKNLYFLFILLLPSFLLEAQIPPVGGGAYIFPKEEACLSNEKRIEIKTKLETARDELRAEGILHPPSSQRAAVLFAWPLRKNADLNFFDFFGVSNFVDHNPTATGAQYGASNLDYQCGNRTYDSNNGYNHQGTDYFTWPFGTYLQENNLVEVIAAEAGIIVLKNDGNDDDHCSCFGNWNAVYIEHADGSVAWYGHLKRNSLLSKAVGMSVSQGEYLGIVGSSGCSSAPHLHFEVYDNNNNLIDPYFGACNNMNNATWWINQPDFREPSVNALLTHDAPPVHGCNADEIPNLQDTFFQGQQIITAIYFHDQLQNDLTNLRIRRPNNTVYSSWSHTSPNTYNASWWYWTTSLIPSAPYGTWQFEVTYKGQDYVHEFVYADPDCFTGIKNQWVGPNNGNWSDVAENWSRGFIPKYCDDVIIPNGKTVDILAGENHTCLSLEIQTGGRLNIDPTAILNVRNN